MNMHLADQIEVNPQVMRGKPVIRGTRIPVELLLRKLAGGATSKPSSRPIRNSRPQVFKRRWRTRPRRSRSNTPKPTLPDQDAFFELPNVAR